MSRALLDQAPRTCVTLLLAGGESSPDRSPRRDAASCFRGSSLALAPHLWSSGAMAILRARLVSVVTALDMSTLIAFGRVPGLILTASSPRCSRTWFPSKLPR